MTNIKKVIIEKIPSDKGIKVNIYEDKKTHTGKLLEAFTCVTFGDLNRANERLLGKYNISL